MGIWEILEVRKLGIGRTVFKKGEKGTNYSAQIMEVCKYEAVNGEVSCQSF